MNIDKIIKIANSNPTNQYILQHLDMDTVI